MDNSTSIFIVNSTSEADIEKDSLLRILFVTSSYTVYIIFDCTVIVALSRTKTIPSMAKFLAMSLLLCYALIAITAICRRVIGSHYDVFSILTVLAVAIRMTTYEIIAMLTLDRVIVIQFPFLYCRHLPSVKVKCIAAVIMFSVFLWLVVGIGLSCNFTSTQSDLSKLTCFKNRSPPFSAPIIITTVVTVCVGVFIISKTVCQQSKVNQTKILSAVYKTTTVVLANIISCLLTVVLYIFAVVSIDSFQTVLILSEMLTGVNALADAVIYALWFKECRLELLKMATICIPRLERKVERLRYEVFYINFKENTTV